MPVRKSLLRRSLVAAALSLALVSGLPSATTAQQGGGARVERQGSELVYRSNIPGNGMTLRVLSDRIEGVGGCPDFGDCSLAGITAIRIFMDDGGNNMNVEFRGADVPVFLDGGGGDNELHVDTGSGRPPSGRIVYTGGSGSDKVSGVTRAFDVDTGGGADRLVGLGGIDRLVAVGGAGDDSILAAGAGANASGSDVPGTPGAGPYSVEGGDGDDEIDAAIGAGGRITVNGGAGDDSLRADGAGSVVSCGLGADLLRFAEGDVGDGCAPQIDLPTRRTIGTYSIGKRQLALKLGRMERAGGRLRIKVTKSGPRVNGMTTAIDLSRPRTLRPDAGRLQVRLPMTKAGQRYFRRSGTRKKALMTIDVDDPRTGDRGVSHARSIVLTRRR